VKALKARLTSNKGETLVESLLSILLVTLASILFFSMLTAAANINETAKLIDEKVQHKELVTAMGPSAAGAVITDGTVTISGTVDGQNETLCSVQVQIVRAQAGDALYAYYLPQASTGGAAS
jgi:competence protein ComGC